MRKITLSVVGLMICCSALCLPVSGQSDDGDIDGIALNARPIHSSVEKAVGNLLSVNHYKKRKVDNTLSSEMFESYLDLLDNGKFYFLQSDIDEFEQQYRFQFDDAVKSGDLSGAFFIFNRFQKRLRSRHGFIEELLEKDFDFTVDEYFNVEREDASWAETESQLQEIWRKRVKNEVLGLRLAGKEAEDIAETLRKRYNNILKRIDQTDSEDVFNLYLNAFAESFDPHTSYMSPQMSDDFKIRISKSLEGIGATLQIEDEFTKVVEIVPGGPADKSGLLHPNDRIIGVGQGDNEEIVDVIGWRISDVVQLIRGPKDSKVRLQILPAEAPVYGEPEEIEIIRDKVRLSDRMAKSEIQEVEFGGKSFKIGIIEIPDFYFDYESMQNGDPDFASTSRDVKRLLADLNEASVDGVIIDLRQNGGGYLSEAINLTGLFIKDGPVVQVRTVQGEIEEQKDEDQGVYYDGPLAVLVDRLSASASEIFAAAIQDYGRGIVVGSPTFGKGTVQSIIPLERLRMFDGSEERLGQVKLTVAKFYRINGHSTQHEGVTPDFQLPSRYQAMEVGESDYENALLWDEIGGASYDPWKDGIRNFIPELVENFKVRLNDNPEYRYLQEDIKQILQQRENTLISLQEEKRKREKEEADAAGKQRENERSESGIDGDLFLTETQNILCDYFLMTRSEIVTTVP